MLNSASAQLWQPKHVVVMQTLLEMVCMNSGSDLQATAAIALAHLARYPANRCAFVFFPPLSFSLTSHILEIVKPKRVGAALTVCLIIHVKDQDHAGCGC